MQYINLEDTVYLYVATNGTSGSGMDATGDVFVEVREEGAASGAPAVFSITAVRLTASEFPSGSYEVAIPATSANGFFQDKTYGVFAWATVDGVNPTGVIGVFRTQAVPANAQTIANNAITNAVIQDAAISSAKFATDALDANALAADAVTEIQAGLSTFDASTEDVNLASTGLDQINIDGMSMPVATRVIFAGVAGKVSGVGSGTETFVGADGTTDRMVSVVDTNGNRTGVTYP